jgi:hypothetical protein
MSSTFEGSKIDVSKHILSLDRKTSDENENDRERNHMIQQRKRERDEST